MLECCHAHLCTWVYQIGSTGLRVFQKWKLKIGHIFSQTHCSHWTESQNISQPLMQGNCCVLTQLFILAASNRLSSFWAPPRLSIPVWLEQLRLLSESDASWHISQHMEYGGYCRASEFWVPIYPPMHCQAARDWHGWAWSLCGTAIHWIKHILDWLPCILYA